MLDNAQHQLSDEEQIKLFVGQTTELFQKERGKSVAKKNNYGDTISTQVETSVIIQQHLISPDALKCIEREKTMIYGNVKACIPLCRQKLRAEFSKKAGAPRYRKDELIAIDEEMAFGIVTKS